MIANSKFSNKKEDLPAINKNVQLMKAFIESRRDMFELELYENQTKEETDGIIQKRKDIVNSVYNT
jgi:hypothetical protein